MMNGKTVLKWIAKIIGVIFSIIIIVVISLYLYSVITQDYTSYQNYTIPSEETLDFQNKSGVARIHSTFTEVLIASSGSQKKGNGYVLFLTIINPSSIVLRNITCDFNHSYSNKSATYQNVNLAIYPGSSKTVKCTVADLLDSDLKSITVSVHFDQISYH